VNKTVRLLLRIGLLVGVLAVGLYAARSVLYPH